MNLSDPELPVQYYNENVSVTKDEFDKLVSHDKTAFGRSVVLVGRNLFGQEDSHYRLLPDRLKPSMFTYSGDHDGAFVHRKTISNIPVGCLRIDA